MNLYLDIETLPAVGGDIEVIKKFWEEQKAKSAKNGAYGKKVASDFDSFFRNTSFQGEFGRILCLCYAVDDGEIQSLSGDEKEILQKFWGVAKDADTFIGHNIMEFDLRFIYKRSIINNVRPSRDLSFARYRSSPIFDTMKEWEKWGAQGVSLHKLSVAFGIASPKEEGIDGSKVYDYYLAGKTDEIIKYCKRDVEATRKVYKRMTFK
ncbi:MAG TPA: ribonuclease H-like domain-containing protein [Patescibacteria group bacterium]|nr:ribonuclease H-like domain-containing protein [Patescibacteria group bacterium]